MQANNKFRIIRTWSLLALTLFVTACTYHDPLGGRWEVDPRAVPLPNGDPANPDCVPVKVGERTIGGTVYHMIDSDCDGTPDYAYDPATGKAYKVRPSFEPVIESLSNNAEVIKYELEEIGVLHQLLTHTQPEYEIVFEDEFEFDFDFGDMTTAEWRDQYQLGGDYGVYVDTSMIEFQVNTINQQGFAIIPWSTVLFVADHTEFNVDLGMYMLFDSPGEETGPGGLAIGVSGNVVDIAAFILQMSDSGYTELETSDEEWLIVADEAAGIVTLFHDGQYHSEYDL